MPGLLLADEQHTSAGPLALEEMSLEVIDPVALAQSFGLIVVIVDADDVGCDALPAVVSKDRAAGIEGLGQVIEGLNIVTLGGAIGQVGNAP
jgi:hypothetical protein